ncbi:MAG: hypothetical protein IT359_02900 [Gemmatimonadaceae bacterium]|nr:hypothetical protein [Gemmatimonadaceae bacterium]
MTVRSEPVQAPTLVAAFRRHERRLAALWLAGTALLCLITLVRPARQAVLTLLGRAVDRYEWRWNERLGDGVALYQRGDFAGAAAYLERLDGIYPARSNRFARDREREYLLRILALSHEKAGKSGAAMRTWERLVAFDSLNFQNHVGYAQAAQRLLSGWAMAEEAKDGYAAALRKFPAHLPSVRGYMSYYMDRGEFEPVVTAWEAYLGSYFPQRVTVALGDSSVTVLVPTDGEAHDVEFAFTQPAPAGELHVRTGGFAVALDSAAVVTALRAGDAAGRARVPLDLSTLRAADMARDTIAWLPKDTTSALVVPVPGVGAPIARVQLRLRLFKPADQGTWAMVRKSYRNLLRWDALAHARLLTATFVDAADADRLYAQVRWLPPGVRGDAP